MERKYLGYNLLEEIDNLLDYEKSENTECKNNAIVLADGYNEGYIESKKITTDTFDKLVCSWVALTDKTKTVEVQVKVRVDGNWSKYLTYGVWGLGRENYYYDDEDADVKIYVDEVLIKNNKKADGVQYKVILRKEGSISPELRNICVMMHTDHVEYTQPECYLPSVVEYAVPRLNQNIVPVIGHECCSATTSAMLLKFHGFDFKEYDEEFEHRYVASLVADPGHNNPTFGNWAFNTAVMGAFGLKSYVARMAGWEELKYHLAKVGPVGASIRGDTGVYKTGGHLLVVVGYKEVDGKTFVICNDPNINSRFGEGLFVRYEYPLETFMAFWRNVAYVVKKY